MSTMDPTGDRGGGPPSSTPPDDSATPVTPSTGLAVSPGSYHQQHPPPSPLSGCYLLVVLPEPHTAQHRDLIINRLAKGFLSWDKDSCHVDLEKELQALVAQAPEGEEARNGERLIQYATENLVTEVLIHPQTNTLLQCMRNLLASFTKHRHIIHAGYTFSGNGSWILQDGTFSLADFLDAFSEHEVQRVLRAYENSVTVDINCAGVGEWSTSRLSKEPCTRSCRVRLNPDDVLTAGVSAITSFTNYVGQYLVSQTLDQLMEPSDVVGNIRFSHPTLYVFPGGQGDAALFGINGFNMLIDGGFARKACFWDFARHLDRLDAVLMTRINNSNVGGMSSVLRKKREMHVYPQIGHFFCNLIERKNLNSPDGDKDLDPLILNLTDIGHEMMVDLRHINLRAHPCYRDPNPINLYHKVGHGTLDMYVLSPSKDSREVREFLNKWHTSDSKLFSGSYKKDSNNLTFPIQNLASICALLVWVPANPEDTITRILFPGSTPQHKIFEGIERLKHLEFLKHPVCTPKSTSPCASLLALKDKTTTKQRLGLTDESKKSTEIKKDKRDLIDAKLSKTADEPGIKPTPHAIPITHTPKLQSSKIDGKTKKVVDNRKIETESKKIEKDLKEHKKENVKKDGLKTEKDPETKKSEPYKPRVDHEKSSLTKDAKTKLESKKKETKEPKQIKISKAEAVPKSIGKPSDKKQKPSADKKDLAKPLPPTPRKGINGAATKVEATKIGTRPITKPSGKLLPSTMPAKSAKDANNRKVVEQKNIEIASAAGAAVSAATKVPTKQKTAERKPIGRRTKPVSPIKARMPISPIKSTRSTPTTSVKSDKDGIVRKVKGDRGTTDSSTVSTPSGIEIDSMTKLADKCLTEKSEDMSLDSIESKVLADLKEEREVVEEIEAVLQKAERIEGARRDDHLDGDDDITAEATDKKEDDMTEDDVTADIDELPKKESSRKTSHEMTEEDEYLIVEKEEIYIEDSVQSGEGEEKRVGDITESQIVKTIKDTVVTKEGDEDEEEGEEEEEEEEEGEEVEEEDEEEDDGEVSDEKEKADIPEKNLGFEKKKELLEEDLKDTESDVISSIPNADLKEQVKNIIASATEIVHKTEDKDDSGKKDSDDITKEPSSLSHDKFDSSEKKTTETDIKPEIDQREQQIPEKLEESHERISTLESGATTTAPTLPEDERIPLDEIKEVMDEKHLAEQEKKADNALHAQEPSVAQVTTEPKPDTKAFEVHPPLHGIQREIVKTPDEVADLPVHEEVDPTLYHMEHFEKTKEEKSIQPALPPREIKEPETPPVKEQKGVFSFFGKVADKFEKGIDKLTGKSRRDSEKDMDEKSSSKSGSPKEVKSQTIPFPGDAAVHEVSMAPTKSAQVSDVSAIVESDAADISKTKVAIKETDIFLKSEIEDTRKISALADEKKDPENKPDLSDTKSTVELDAEIDRKLKPSRETLVSTDQKLDLDELIPELDAEEDAEEVKALLVEASKKFKTVKDSLHDSLESLEEKIAEQEMVRVELEAVSKDLIKDTLCGVVEKLVDIKPDDKDETTERTELEKDALDVPEVEDAGDITKETISATTKDLKEAVRDVGEVLAGSAGIVIEDKPKDVVEIVKKVAEVLKKDDFLSPDILFDTNRTKDEERSSEDESELKKVETEGIVMQKNVELTDELQTRKEITESREDVTESIRIDENIDAKTIAPEDACVATQICSENLHAEFLPEVQKTSDFDKVLKSHVAETDVEPICTKQIVEESTSVKDATDLEIQTSKIIFDRKRSPTTAEVVMVTPDISPTAPKFLPLDKTCVKESELEWKEIDDTSLIPIDVKNTLQSEKPLEKVIEDLVLTKKMKITLEIIEYITVIREISRDRVIHIIIELITEKCVPLKSVIADPNLLQRDVLTTDIREDLEHYVHEEYITKNKKITTEILQNISTEKFVTKRILIESIIDLLTKKDIAQESILDIEEIERSQRGSCEETIKEQDIAKMEAEVVDREGTDAAKITALTDENKYLEIKQIIEDEVIAKGQKITPQFIDDVCVTKLVPRQMFVDIIEKMIIECNISRSLMFDISEKELSELLASEKEHSMFEPTTEGDVDGIVSFRSEKKLDIIKYVSDEFIAKKKKITPIAFKDICDRNDVSKETLLVIIEEIVEDKSLLRTSVLDISQDELAELSVVEDEPVVGGTEAESTDTHSEQQLAPFGSGVMDSVSSRSDIEKCIVEEYVLKQRRITPYMFEDICIRYKIPRRIIIEIIEEIIIKRKVQRNVILDISDTELSELLAVVEAQDEDQDVQDVDEDKLLEGFVSISSKDDIKEDIAPAKHSADCIVTGVEKDIDDFEAVEQEYKIHGIPAALDSLSTMKVGPIISHDKITDDADDTIDDHISGVVEAKEKLLESPSAPVATAKIKQESEDIPESSKIVDTTEKYLTEAQEKVQGKMIETAHPSIESVKSSALPLEKCGYEILDAPLLPESVEHHIVQDSLENEITMGETVIVPAKIVGESTPTVTLEDDGKEETPASKLISTGTTDEQIVAQKSVLEEDNLRTEDADVVMMKGARKVAAKHQEEEPELKGHEKSVFKIDQIPPRNELSSKDVSVGEETVLSSFTADRMVVAATNEDGRRETYACPEESIVCTPDVSLESSPIKTTPNQDSLQSEKELVRSGISTPDKDSVSGKSAISTKDGSKITPEDSLDRSPSGTRDSQDLEDSLAKSDLSKVKDPKAPQSPAEEREDTINRQSSTALSLGLLEKDLAKPTDKLIKSSSILSEEMQSPTKRDALFVQPETGEVQPIERCASPDQDNKHIPKYEEALDKKDMLHKDDQEKIIVEISNASKIPSIIGEKTEEDKFSERKSPINILQEKSIERTATGSLSSTSSPADENNIDYVEKNIGQPSKSPDNVCEKDVRSQDASLSMLLPSIISGDKSDSKEPLVRPICSSADTEKLSILKFETPAGTVGVPPVLSDRNEVLDAVCPKTVSSTSEICSAERVTDVCESIPSEKRDRIVAEVSVTAADAELSAKDLMDKFDSSDIAIDDQSYKVFGDRSTSPSIATEIHENKEPTCGSKSISVAIRKYDDAEVSQHLQSLSIIPEKKDDIEAIVVSASDSVEIEAHGGEGPVDHPTSSTIGTQGDTERVLRSRASSITSEMLMEKKPIDGPIQSTVTTDTSSNIISESPMQKDPTGLSRSPSGEDTSQEVHARISYSRSSSIASDKLDLKEQISSTISPETQKGEELTDLQEKSRTTVEMDEVNKVNTDSSSACLATLNQDEEKMFDSAVVLSIIATEQDERKSIDHPLCSPTAKEHKGKEKVEVLKLSTTAGYQDEKDPVERGKQAVIHQSRLPSIVTEKNDEAISIDQPESPSAVGGERKEIDSSRSPSFTPIKQVEGELTDDSKSGGYSAEITDEKKEIDRSRSSSIVSEKQDEKVSVDRIESTSDATETSSDKQQINRSRSPSISAEKQDEQQSFERSRSSSSAAEKQAKGETTDGSRSPSITGEKQDVKESDDHSRVLSPAAEKLDAKGDITSFQLPVAATDKQDQKEPIDYAKPPSTGVERSAEEEQIDRSRASSIASEVQDDKKSTDGFASSSSAALKEDGRRLVDSKSDREPLRKPDIIQQPDRSTSSSIAADKPGEMESIDRSTSISDATGKEEQTVTTEYAMLPVVLAEKPGEKKQIDCSRSLSITPEKEGAMQLTHGLTLPSIAPKRQVEEHSVPVTRSPSITPEKDEEGSVASAELPSATTGKLVERSQIKSNIVVEIQDKKMSIDKKSPSISAEQEDEKESCDHTEPFSPTFDSSGKKEEAERSKSPSIVGGYQDEEYSIDSSMSPTIIAKKQELPLDHSKSPSDSAKQWHQTATFDSPRSPSITAELQVEKLSIDLCPSAVLAIERQVEKEPSDHSTSPNTTTEKFSEDEQSLHSRASSIAAEIHDERESIPSRRSSIITEKHDETKSIAQSRSPSIVAENESDKVAGDKSKLPNTEKQYEREQKTKEIEHVDHSQEHSITCDMKTETKPLDASGSPTVIGQEGVITESVVQSKLLNVAAEKPGRQEQNVCPVLSNIEKEKQGEEQSTDGSKSPSIVLSSQDEIEHSESLLVATVKHLQKEAIDHFRSPSIADEKQEDKELTESSTPSSITSDVHTEKELIADSESLSSSFEKQKKNETLDHSKSITVVSEEHKKKESADSVTLSAGEEQTDIDSTNGSRSPCIEGEKQDKKESPHHIEPLKAEAPTIVDQEHDGKESIDRSRSPSIATEKETTGSSQSPRIVSQKQDEKESLDRSESFRTDTEKQMEESADRPTSLTVLHEKEEGKGITPFPGVTDAKEDAEQLPTHSESLCITVEGRDDKTCVDRSRSPSIADDRVDDELTPGAKSPSITGDEQVKEESSGDSKCPDIAGEQEVEKELFDHTKSRSPSVDAKGRPGAESIDGSESLMATTQEEHKTELPDHSEAHIAVTQKHTEKETVDCSISPSIAGEKLLSTESTEDSASPSSTADKLNESKYLDKSKLSPSNTEKQEVLDRSGSPTIAVDKLSVKESNDGSASPSITSDNQAHEESIAGSRSSRITEDKQVEKESTVGSRSPSISGDKQLEKESIAGSRSPSITGDKKGEKESTDDCRSPSITGDIHTEKVSTDRSRSPSITDDKRQQRESTAGSRSPSISGDKQLEQESIADSRSPSLTADKKSEKESIDGSRSPSITDDKQADKQSIDGSKSPVITQDKQGEKESTDGSRSPSITDDKQSDKESIDGSKSPVITRDKEGEKESTDGSRSPSIAGDKLTEKASTDRSRSPSIIGDKEAQKESTAGSRLPSITGDKQIDKESSIGSRSSSITGDKQIDKQSIAGSRSPSITGDEQAEKVSIAGSRPPSIMGDKQVEIESIFGSRSPSITGDKQVEKGSNASSRSPSISGDKQVERKPADSSTPSNVTGDKQTEKESKDSSRSPSITGDKPDDKESIADSKSPSIIDDKLIDKQSITGSRSPSITGDRQAEEESIAGSRPPSIMGDEQVERESISDSRSPSITSDKQVEKAAAGDSKSSCIISDEQVEKELTDRSRSPSIFGDKQVEKGSNAGSRSPSISGDKQVERKPADSSTPSTVTGDKQTEKESKDSSRSPSITGDKPDDKESIADSKSPSIIDDKQSTTGSRSPSITGDRQAEEESIAGSRPQSIMGDKQVESESIPGSRSPSITGDKQVEKAAAGDSKSSCIISDEQAEKELTDRSRSPSIFGDKQVEKGSNAGSRSPSISGDKQVERKPVDSSTASSFTGDKQTDKESKDSSRSPSITGDKPDDKESIADSKSPSIIDDKPIDKQSTTDSRSPSITGDRQAEEESIAGSRPQSIMGDKQVESESIPGSRSPSITGDKQVEKAAAGDSKSSCIISDEQVEKELTDRSRSPSIFGDKQVEKGSIAGSRSPSISGDKQVERKPVDSSTASSITGDKQTDKESKDSSRSPSITADKPDDKESITDSKSPSITGDRQAEEESIAGSRSPSITGDKQIDKQSITGSRSPSITGDKLPEKESIASSRSPSITGNKLLEKESIVSARSLSITGDKRFEKELTDGSRSPSISGDYQTEKESGAGSRSPSFTDDKQIEKAVTADSKSPSITSDKQAEKESIDGSRSPSITSDKQVKKESIDGSISPSISGDKQVESMPKDGSPCPSTTDDKQTEKKSIDNLRSLSMTDEKQTEKKTVDDSKSLATAEHDDKELFDPSRSPSISAEKKVDEESTNASRLPSIFSAKEIENLTITIKKRDEQESVDRSRSPSVASEVRSDKESTDGSRSPSIVGDKQDEKASIDYSKVLAAVSEKLGEKMPIQHPKSSSPAAKTQDKERSFGDLRIEKVSIDELNFLTADHQKMDEKKEADHSKSPSISAELQNVTESIDKCRSSSGVGEKQDKDVPIDRSRSPSIAIEECDGKELIDRSKLEQTEKESIDGSAASRISADDRDETEAIGHSRSPSTTADKEDEGKSICGSRLSNAAKQKQDEKESIDGLGLPSIAADNETETINVEKGGIEKIIDDIGSPTPIHEQDDKVDSIKSESLSDKEEKQATLKSIQPSRLSTADNEQFDILKPTDNEKMYKEETKRSDETECKSGILAESIATKSSDVQKYSGTEVTMVQDGRLHQIEAVQALQMLAETIADKSAEIKYESKESAEDRTRTAASIEEKVPETALTEKRCSSSQDLETQYIHGESRQVTVTKDDVLRKLSATEIPKGKIAPSTSGSEQNEGQLPQESHTEMSEKYVAELAENYQTSSHEITKVKEYIVSTYITNEERITPHILNQLQIRYSIPTNLILRVIDLVIEEKNIPRDFILNFPKDDEIIIPDVLPATDHVAAIDASKQAEIERFIVEEYVKKGIKIDIIVLEQIMERMGISKSVLLQIIKRIIEVQKVSRVSIIDDVICDELKKTTNDTHESSPSKDSSVQISGKSTPDPKSSGYSTPEVRQYDEKLDREMPSYGNDYETPFHKAFVGGMTEIRTTHITTLSGKSTPDYTTDVKQDISEEDEQALKIKVIRTKVIDAEEPIIEGAKISTEVIKEKPEIITKLIHLSATDQTDMTISECDRQTISPSGQETIPELIKVVTTRSITEETSYPKELSVQIMSKTSTSDSTDTMQHYRSEGKTSEEIKTITTTTTTRSEPVDEVSFHKTVKISDTLDEFKSPASSTSTDIRKHGGSPIEKDTLVSTTSSSEISKDPDHEKTMIEKTKSQIESHFETVGLESSKAPASPMIKDLVSDQRSYSGTISPDISVVKDMQFGTVKSAADIQSPRTFRDWIMDDSQRSGRSTPDKRPTSRSSTATPESMRSNEVIRTTITTTRTMSEEGDIITTTMEITETTNEKGETIILDEKTDVQVQDRFIPSDANKGFAFGIVKSRADTSSAMDVHPAKEVSPYDPNSGLPFGAPQTRIDAPRVMDVDPLSPRSDHSSIHSRADTHVWGGSEERHLYSDDDVPGSPLSTTSQVDYSPQSTYQFDEHSFDKGQAEKTMEFSEADMGASFYGRLPDLPPLAVKTTYSKGSDTEAACDSGTTDSDFSFKKLVIPQKSVDTTKDSKTDTKEFGDEASMERKEIKMDSELTGASETASPHESSPSQSNVKGREQQMDAKKDPLAEWDAPLGLPSPKPPRKFNLRTVARSNDSGDLSPDSISFDPVKNWGEPLRLPSPASFLDEASNKGAPGTPKKEKKQPKKVISENIKNRKRSESPVKTEKKSKDTKSKIQPVYMDLTYVPHHGNSYYTSVEFFKRVRARYYVFSGTEPSREVYDALLDAKKTWEDKDLEVTMIPTYDTDTLGYWVADNEEALAANHIDLSPSASRCTINLQDHETSCSAYRLEF